MERGVGGDPGAHLMGRVAGLLDEPVIGPRVDLFEFAGCQNLEKMLVPVGVQRLNGGGTGSEVSTCGDDALFAGLAFGVARIAAVDQPFAHLLRRAGELRNRWVVGEPSGSDEQDAFVQFVGCSSDSFAEQPNSADGAEGFGDGVDEDRHGRYCDDRSDE